MVAYALSRLHSAELDETALSEEIPECYIEVVNNIFSSVKTTNSDVNAEQLTVGIPAKSTTNGFLLEPCNGTLCQEAGTIPGETDSS